ncbi:unnamed protein product [Brassica oleracea var. botrytis]
MTTRCITKGRSQRRQNFLSSIGTGDNRLNWERYGSYHRAVEETVLATPWSICRICYDQTITSYCGWWCLVRLVDKMLKFMAFKQCSDLSAPHQVIEITSFVTLDILAESRVF